MGRGSAAGATSLVIGLLLVACSSSATPSPATSSPRSSELSTTPAATLVTPSPFSPPTPAATTASPLGTPTSTPPASARSTITAISTGWTDTCAITGEGGVACWGANRHHELGNGTTIDSATPVAVSGLAHGIRAISVGSHHACALTTEGAVKCWGSNDVGQLGNGTTKESGVPVTVTGLSSGVIGISAGGGHTCALTTHGGVMCWGTNGVGQLGLRDPTIKRSLVPAEVSGLTSGITAIAAGIYDTCALTTGGGITCWGQNDYGQLGDGTTTNRATPVMVSGLASGATAIAAGHLHTCALTTDGAVRCWGDNVAGQLGDGGPRGSFSRIPVDVPGLPSGVSAIAAGVDHTCAATSGGVMCWGSGDNGQLGDGSTTSSNTPVAVSGLATTVRGIAAGLGYTCSLLAAGAVSCWGFNNHGQLGDGSMDPSTVPVDVDFTMASGAP